MNCDQKNSTQSEVYFREKLRKIDLNPILDWVIYKYEWNREKTLGAITFYQMFLFLLYLYPNKTIVPPLPEIDLIWHEHILNTPKYIEDSQMLFGRYIHHVPTYSLTPESQKQTETAWSETLDLWRQHFGAEILANANSDNQSDKESEKTPKTDCIHPADPNIT